VSTERRTTVAVAVVSFNERELLASCLGSLQADAEAGLAEVWVVDNASSDGSPDMVREQFPWVRLIRSRENLGYGPAINRVAERSDAEWIAPANQDVALDPGALAAMLRAAEARPRAGAVAPRLIGPDGATQHSVHPFPTVGLTVGFNLGLHRLSRRLADRLCIEGYWNADLARRVPWAIAAFLLVRRRALDAAGGFDESMWLHAEDVDLGWRLERAGWETWYEPSARVRHMGSVSTRKAFGSGVEARFMQESYRWMVRRWGRPRARVVASVNFAGAASKALLLSPLARVLPERFLGVKRHYARWARIHAQGLDLTR
jgi:N-acetylglucosaminyl-diphospho-decaprenol L-rhamnosyltransferase